jgi:cobalt/nickel transport system ATP-binding protein
VVAGGAASLIFSMLLLVPVSVWTQGMTWTEARMVPLAIGLRGAVVFALGVSTLSVLDATALQKGLSDLSVPRGVVMLIVQIAHQTALLTDETRRVCDALRVRGVFSACARCRMRVLFALPVIWLLRLIARAERVGHAMEVRGFGSIGKGGLAREQTCPAVSTALVIDRVSVRYCADRPPVLTDVSITLRAGERVAVMGLNGAGKTTLLRAVAGLVPFEGRIEVASVPLTAGNERRVRDRLGFLFGTPDDQILFPRVIDDVAFSLERRGISRPEAKERAKAALDALDLEALAEAAPNELSQGQRQRVALAGALISSPLLLLLDEPSAALDSPGKAALVAILSAQPAALLLATHDEAFAHRVCQRFIALKNGRIVSDTGTKKPQAD